MKTYRKLPVVIHAQQFTGLDSYREIVERLRDLGVTVADDVRYETPIMLIPTLEGTMSADVGDWIIVGVKGEVYPCKPDIFSATYEEVA